MHNQNAGRVYAHVSRQDTATNLEKGLFSWFGCVPSDERHDATAPLDVGGSPVPGGKNLSVCVVAGVLLSVPVQEQVVAGVKDGAEQLQQVQVRVGGRNAPGHDLEVAGYLPLGDVGDPAVVYDGLRTEQLEQSREDQIKVRRIDGPLDDQVPLLLELLSDHTLVDLDFHSASHEG
jgi:hypothetical protein